MVSDFVEKVGGYLRHGETEARLLLETNKDGYFFQQWNVLEAGWQNNEEKYPNAQALFMFDTAPSHRKCPKDAGNVNVNRGGKQPVMRGTIWNGNVQKMVLPDGRPEDGPAGKRNRDEEERLKATLESHPDFQNPKTLVEERVEARGVFSPKYHCGMERCWCHSKMFSRANCNGSIRLRSIVPQALDTATTETIHGVNRREFRVSQTVCTVWGVICNARKQCVKNVILQTLSHDWGWVYFFGGDGSYICLPTQMEQTEHPARLYTPGAMSGGSTPHDREVDDQCPVPPAPVAM